MEYWPLPSSLCNKLIFKSFQLPEKAEKIGSIYISWLKAAIYVFCLMNIP